MNNDNNARMIGSRGVQFGGGILALLALSIFINYVDRGNLATAAPLIKSEMQLTNAQYGLLVSAFYWVYVPGQIIAAWLVQRINAYRTLAIGLGVWSAATVASGLAAGFATLLLFRVLLGIGESAGFPASSKLLAQHVSPERLGKANALVSSGIFLGPAVGTFLGGLFMVCRIRKHAKTSARADLPHRRARHYFTYRFDQFGGRKQRVTAHPHGRRTGMICESAHFDGIFVDANTAVDDPNRNGCLL